MMKYFQYPVIIEQEGEGYLA